MCTHLTKGNYCICIHAAVIRPGIPNSVRTASFFYKGFARSVAQQEYPHEAILGRGSGYELKSKARSVGVAQRGDLGNLFLYYLCAHVWERVSNIVIVVTISMSVF